MEERYPGLLTKAHLWTDLVLLNFSFMAAYFIRFHSLENLFDNQYVVLLLEANLVWIFAIYLLKSYHFTRLSFNFRNQLENLLKAALLHAAIIMGMLYLDQKGDEYSRKQFVMTYGIFLAIAILTRAAIVTSIYIYREAGYNSSRYAILGKGDLATMIKDFYSDRKELGYRFCGIYGFEENSDQIRFLELLMAEQKLDYIYCCLSEMTDTQIRNVIKLGERQKTHIRLVPDFRGFITNKATIEYHDMMPIIHVNTRPFSNVNEQNLKRALDLIFSLMVITMGFPMFLLLIIIIKISSPGPVFYRQQRCGQWGKMFEIYKFRSMVINADQLGQHSQGDLDPRITSIGRLLRKSRLDELPQFINVLKGDMSVVGPRPLFKYDVDMLMKEAPHDFQRLLTVKPGITSIGQIQVGYADTVTKNVERLKYDLLYLKEYSILDDITLIIKTMQVMLSGRGQ